jgi:hypothetical protein
MSETPPPPPGGGDPNQPPPPTTPYPQQPVPQGWQPGWQPSWQPTTGGQPPGQQRPYGEPPPQVPYGAPQLPAYGPLTPDHPKATTVLVLGILGIVLCGLIAPFAWVMGNQVIREIDASGGTMGGRANANAGRICGMIGTILIGVGVLFLFAALAVGLAGAARA